MSYGEALPALPGETEEGFLVIVGRLAIGEEGVEIRFDGVNVEAGAAGANECQRGVGQLGED